MPSKNYGGLFLSIIFILIGLTLLLRIYVESTHYLSPDSNFYIRVSENIKSGKGAIAPITYPFDENTEESTFAIWPIGYPLLIAMVSSVANTSSFISSKLVNLIFLGLIFLLLHKWIGEYAWVPSLYFLSYGKLEVFSYTWSEGPFLFFVILLSYFLSRDLKIGKPNLTFLYIFLTLISLFLLRYAGIVYFFMVTGWMIWHYLKKNYQISLHYFIGLLLASIVVIAYLYHNHSQTGYLTGGERVYLTYESFTLFFTLLAKGLLNEFLLARNYWGTWEPVLIFTVTIQLLVLLAIIQKRKKFSWSGFPLERTTVLLSVGIFYLFSIVIIRKMSPFDVFNYRTLSPFSTPIFIGLLATVAEFQNRKFLKETSWWIVGFMSFCLLMNLPKIYIINLLFNLVWN